MNYFLAPRSGEKSHKNFQSTIRHGIPLRSIELYLRPEEINILQEEEVIYAWGNRAGTKTSWDKMQMGDIVIFYAHKKLVMAGEIYFKKHSPELALAMWPADENGNPWEYTFFLRNLKYINIPIEVFCVAAGYEPKFVVQKFMPITAGYLTNIQHTYGSVEEMLTLFQDGNSAEIPRETEKVYVNISNEIVPLIITRTNLYPRSNSVTVDFVQKRKYKIDYLERNKNNSIVGSKGEELVLLAEKKRLIELGRHDLAEKVERLSLEDDSVGYDILSYEEDGSERHIEVKTSTSENKFVKFHISSNEYLKGRNKSDYFIYFVEKINSSQPKISIFQDPIKDEMLKPDGYIFEADRT